MAKKKKEGTGISKEIAEELAKGSLTIYRRLVKEADGLDTLLVRVVTREGNEKPEVHPIVNAIAQAAETLRRQLSELLVTPKSKKTSRNAGGGADGDDPLSKMVERLTELDDD